MSMFGGFGPGGMGMQDMSGMNMGTGFGGGFGGNWNGQQGMGGNFGAGYYPNAGYNQQQMHQGGYANQQFPNHNNYQNQNRFQQRGGFAGRGRGGAAFAGGNAGPSNPQVQPDDAAYPQDVEHGDRRPSRAGTESAEAGAERRNSQSVASVSQMPGDDATAPEQQTDAIDEDTNEQVPQGEEQTEDQGLENGDEMQGMQHEEGNQMMNSNNEGKRIKQIVVVSITHASRPEHDGSQCLQSRYDGYGWFQSCHGTDDAFWQSERFLPAEQLQWGIWRKRKGRVQRQRWFPWPGWLQQQHAWWLQWTHVTAWRRLYCGCRLHGRTSD